MAGSQRARACSSFRNSLVCTAAALAGLLLVVPSASATQLYFADKDVHLLVDQSLDVKLTQDGAFNKSFEIVAQIQHPDLLRIDPASLAIPGPSGPDASYIMTATGRGAGHSDVVFNATDDTVDMSDVYLRVTVMHSRELYYVSEIMGWVYFVAWSVSFYPQIYTNYRRKSVVGLNFDFLALNIVGFVMYSVFNCGLYFSKTIQSEYFARHPRGMNPVQLNDVFFSLHAAAASAATVAQCLVYERESQRVSWAGRALLGALLAAAAAAAALAAAHVVHWIQFLYVCSYVKLCITLVKYVPQAYMNYKRKSTVGWSIGNIFLDFTGGSLSVLQMLLNAYNYGDWASIFGDVTKFGLGAFSLIFDVFFILQHYVFYRDVRYILLPGTDGARAAADDVTAEEQPYQGPP